MNDVKTAAVSVSSDEEWLMKLFRLLPDPARRTVLVDLASSLAFRQGSKRSRSFFPLGEDDELERSEAVEEFLSLCEPQRPNIIEHGIDWRIDVLEATYQDGLAFGLLGDEETALSYAEHLVDYWSEINKDHGIRNEDDFTHEQAVDYIRNWRAQIIRKLRENNDS